MGDWGGVPKAAIAVSVAAWAIGLCAPAFAQEKPTIVVYGDESRDWMADVQHFADILDARDRPNIVAGKSVASLPENATLVWFGDLSHEPREAAGVPEELLSAVNNLGHDIRDGSAGLAEGEVRPGTNCFTRSIDRADGLPEIAVNFSGEDPQNFCKGLIIAHVLLNAGRWLRDDGTDCLLRDCAMILFGTKP
jgi:hypothetical protein